MLGTTTDGIADYVAGLTPVVLTADTLVTNHGFRNGQATTIRSVLQSGTAVLVDDQGVPRVKCNCGNPLTPPELAGGPRRRHLGRAWKGYAGDEVTAVTAGDVVEQLTLLDIRTGRTYEQPVGSSIGTDGRPPPDGLDGDWVLALREESSQLQEVHVPTDSELRDCRDRPARWAHLEDPRGDGRRSPKWTASVPWWGRSTAAPRTYRSR